MDSFADQRSTEPSIVSPWALLLEASGDSESDDPAAAAASIDADDGDAESCSGGEDGSEELDVVVGKRLVSWGCWMMENNASVAVVGAEGACCPPPLSTEDASDAAEGDRLFWEACIAHGY